MKKYHPRDIFTDEYVIIAIKEMFKNWFDYLGMDESVSLKLMEDTFNSFKNYSSRTGLIEEKLRNTYLEKGVIAQIKNGLMQRAENIYHLIEPFVEGTVLDIGCGPGEIAQLIHNKKRIPVYLTDVIDTQLRKSFAPHLPFKLKDDGGTLPYENNQFDTSLLITALHHCNKPLLELEQACRVTKGNIVIIETIYGVEKKDTSPEVYAKAPSFYDKFHSLNQEQQRKYGTFLDWFLNKMIIGNEVNCPYNFNTPQKWEDIFDHMGLNVVHKKMLGIDQPVVPEYHILYVVRK